MSPALGRYEDLTGKSPRRFAGPLNLFKSENHAAWIAPLWTPLRLKLRHYVFALVPLRFCWRGTPSL